MKNQYIAPEAQLLCFRPVEDLAQITWENLLGGNVQEQDRTPADKASGDISIKI